MVVPTLSAFLSGLVDEQLGASASAGGAPEAAGGAAPGPLQFGLAMHKGVKPSLKGHYVPMHASLYPGGRGWHGSLRGQGAARERPASALKQGKEGKEGAHDGGKGKKQRPWSAMVRSTVRKEDLYRDHSMSTPPYKKRPATATVRSPSEDRPSRAATYATQLPAGQRHSLWRTRSPADAPSATRRVKKPRPHTAAAVRPDYSVLDGLLGGAYSESAQRTAPAPEAGAEQRPRPQSAKLQRPDYTATDGSFSDFLSETPKTPEAGTEATACAEEPLPAASAAAEPTVQGRLRPSSVTAVRRAAGDVGEAPEAPRQETEQETEQEKEQEKEQETEMETETEMGMEEDQGQAEPESSKASPPPPAAAPRADEAPQTPGERVPAASPADTTRPTTPGEPQPELAGSPTPSIPCQQPPSEPEPSDAREDAAVAVDDIAVDMLLDEPPQRDAVPSSPSSPPPPACEPSPAQPASPLSSPPSKLALSIIPGGTVATPPPPPVPLVVSVAASGHGFPTPELGPFEGTPVTAPLADTVPRAAGLKARKRSSKTSKSSKAPRTSVCDGEEPAPLLAGRTGAAGLMDESGLSSASRVGSAASSFAQSRRSQPRTSSTSRARARQQEAVKLAVAVVDLSGMAGFMPGEGTQQKRAPAGKPPPLPAQLDLDAVSSATPLPAATAAPRVEDVIADDNDERPTDVDWWTPTKAGRPEAPPSPPPTFSDVFAVAPTLRSVGDYSVRMLATPGGGKQRKRSAAGTPSRQGFRVFRAEGGVAGAQAQGRRSARKGKNPARRASKKTPYRDVEAQLAKSLATSSTSTPAKEPHAGRFGVFQMAFEETLGALAEDGHPCAPVLEEVKKGYEAMLFHDFHAERGVLLNKLAVNDSKITRLETSLDRVVYERSDLSTQVEVQKATIELQEQQLHRERAERDKLLEEHAAGVRKDDEDYLSDDVEQLLLPGGEATAAPEPQPTPSAAALSRTSSRTPSQIMLAAADQDAISPRTPVAGSPRTLASKSPRHRRGFDQVSLESGWLSTPVDIGITLEPTGTPTVSERRYQDVS